MSIVKVFQVMLLFFFVSTIFTFFLMTTQETIGTTFLDEWTNVSYDLMDGNVAAQNNITATRASYEDAKLPYDTVFLVMWLILEVSIISLAIKTPKIPQWSFMSILFFGSIMMVFMYSFVMDVTAWFLQEFIIDTFPADITYLPFYTFYANWELVIFIVNIVGALVINNIWGKGAGTIATNPFLGGGTNK